MKNNAVLTKTGAVLIVLALVCYIAAIVVGALVTRTAAAICMIAGTVLFIAAMIFRTSGRKEQKKSEV